MKYATGVEAVAESLRTLGFHVDWRPVIPGEDLSEYHKVVAYMAPPTAMSAMWIYGFLWTVYARKDAMLGADDWQMTGMHKAFKQMAIEPYKALWGRLERPGQDEGAAFQDELLEAIDELAKETWSRTLLAPIMVGGDPEKLKLPVSQYATFDPSGFWKLKYAVASLKMLSGAEKKWTFASLLRKDKWLKEQQLTWPVEYFGNRSLKQPRVSELEILQRYKINIGTLSPSHDLRGCGWWRARYVLSAMAGSVLAGDPAELLVLGQMYNHTPKEIEDLSDGDRADVGLAQAKQFWDIAWSQAKLDQFLIDNFS